MRTAGSGAVRPQSARGVNHTRSILDADLTRPVILAADGQVLDGMHRIAKAILSGHDTVPAQRLHEDPDPDWLTPKASEA